ncbi:hypothetical protein DH2020_019520 [Rehmannia glutinosa]|uniref:Uncharacterized protein n=1 Tax=Rehmannia glutinosa TaxID=99300 RepID=A0ABR0WNY2_REHGL
MSGGLSGGSDCSLDADDLVEIRERFKELTKEKEMLRDSKSQSFDLIRRLEFHVKTLSESREEDKKHIADLERELNNCSQEIDYLQDQLNTRNSDLGCPGEQVCSLHLKLTDMGNPVEERHEAGVNILEQNLFETEKLLEEKAQENSRLHELIRDLQLQYLDANKVIDSLEKENKDLKEELQRSDMNIEAFVEKVKEQFHEWLGETDNQSFGKLEKDMSTYGTVLGPLFSKLAIPRAPDADLRSKMAEMSRQIDDYELLVRRLKEELRAERLKAKEEAEDLAQEMAELRYQLTLMLEEECKRRANVEQISLHRIAELEAQVGAFVSDPNSYRLSEPRIAFKECCVNSLSYKCISTPRVSKSFRCR